VIDVGVPYGFGVNLRAIGSWKLLGKNFEAFTLSSVFFRTTM
jgi:hypothetical protein